MARRAPTARATLLLVVAGCGAGDRGGADAGARDSGDGGNGAACTGEIDESGIGAPIGCPVLSLAGQQAARFCDWINAAQGGYGRTMDCGSQGPIATNKNQADCLSGLPDLQVLCPTLTVGQVEDCTLAQGPNLCAYLTLGACAPLRMCACVP
jgi:hypothetical protein